MLNRLLLRLFCSIEGGGASGGGSGAGAGTSGGGSGAGSGAGSGTGAGSGSSSAVAEPEVVFGDPDAIREGDEGAGDGAAGSGDDGDGAATGEDGGLDEGWGDESFDDAGEPGAESGTVDYKQLKEALKAQPELFKQVKRALSENSRYKELSKSPEELRGTLDKLESLGGIEDIEQETQAAATLWNMLGAGDPAIFDQLEKDYGEGLTKLAPHFMDRYLKLDPQGWGHEMSKVFMATLNQAPVGKLSALQAFNQLAQDPKIAEKPEFQRIVEVINRINDIAGAAPQRTVSADDAKLREKSVELTQREQAIYFKQLSGEISPLKKKSAVTILETLTKGRKLTKEAKADLLTDTMGEFDRLCKLDQDFQKNAKALLQANESEKFKKLFQNQLRKSMMRAGSRVWRKYTGIAGISSAEAQKRRTEGQARTETGGGGGATGGMIKTAPPDSKVVDWARMRNEFGREAAEDMFMFKRQYYKKGDNKNKYTF